MELRDYLNVIRARKWVIIQAVVVVTITAIVVSLLQPAVYEGQAKVLINDRDTGAAILGTAISDLTSQPERGLQTQVQLMQLRPLAENVIRKLGLKETPEDLLKEITVSAVGQTNIVTITTRAGDSRMASMIANAMADEFVAWSREYKRESIKAAADEVDQRLEQSKQELLDLGRRISLQGKSDELSAELAIATGSYTTLAGQLEELRIQEQLEVGSGRLVSPAVVTDEKVEPNPKRNGALGLAVGLIFGLGMAFFYEYLDNTIKSSEEAEKVYGAPVLGLIPAEKYDKDEKRRLTLITHSGTPAAEAYRVLRNSLDFINFEHNIKTLLVTSAAPAEGKSTVAANLAAGLAQAGKRVVLLSCDFRRPTTQQFFQVNTMIGLSDVLTGANSLKSALQRAPELQNLLILTSGKLPPNPSELLGSEKMHMLIKELEEWADWVIIDSPPLLAVADGAAVARWVDGVLIVTKGGMSTRDAGKKATEMLTQVGARIIGAVVWGLESTPGGGGYGYYGGKGYKGYYYYADYYNNVPADGRSTKHSKTSTTPSAQTQQQIYIPPTSPGRKFAEALGRVLTGVLAALVVIAIVLLVVYFLDLAMGWGLIRGIGGAL